MGWTGVAALRARTASAVAAGLLGAVVAAQVIVLPAVLVPAILAPAILAPASLVPAFADSTAPSLGLGAAVDRASAYAAGQGIEAGIAVIDRESNYEVGNGDAAATPIPAASVIKLFLAENLIARQRSAQLVLPPADRARLESMITRSDDSAASELYWRYGGSSMITDVATRYRLTGVILPADTSQWELTRITALDVVHFYDRFLDSANPADSSYLVGLLRAATPIAADGFDQFFGIPAALPGETWGIKQGWMCCPEQAVQLHTTGILGTDNRYAVAVLTQHSFGVSKAAAADVLDQIVGQIFPGGRLPQSASSSRPRGALDRPMPTGDGPITITGWAYDPDLPEQTALVEVWVDGEFLDSIPADLRRGGARHGFRVELSPARGLHEVCGWARNLGRGVQDQALGCVSVLA